MIEIPAGTASLGLPRQKKFLAGTMNLKRHSVGSSRLFIDEHKVTNGEFLKFVREGGYKDSSLWSKEDWEWIEHEGIRQPKFWIQRPILVLRAMFAEIPLPLDWPVYVSHAEAAAYARWAGKQLPTEEQFHRAAYGTRKDARGCIPGALSAPSERHGNFDFARWDPSSVHAHPDGRSAFGVADLIGNGWEWTSTLFKPFPGFQTFSFLPWLFGQFF